MQTTYYLVDRLPKILDLLDRPTAEYLGVEVDSPLHQSAHLASLSAVSSFQPAGLDNLMVPLIVGGVLPF